MSISQGQATGPGGIGDLPECLTFMFNCSASIPLCRNSARVDAVSLWEVTTRYVSQCPHGLALFKSQSGPISPDEASFTYAACKAMAGAGYTPYPRRQMWYLWTTWKAPLFQLIASSPRPPLGLVGETFSILHLLGDPIGANTDLLLKIDDCQRRAEFWRGHFNNKLAVRDKHSKPGHNEDLEQRLWKSFALIIVSYDEWGLSVGERVTEILRHKLNQLSTTRAGRKRRGRFLGICINTAEALAADRATTFLPICVAQTIFIFSLVIAITRTKSPSSTANISTETYNIAYACLFFWLIFTVILASIVGTSQTAAAIPRILDEFRNNLSREFPDTADLLPVLKDPSRHSARFLNGGIYSWQPGRNRGADVVNPKTEAVDGSNEAVDGIDDAFAGNNDKFHGLDVAFNRNSCPLSNPKGPWLPASLPLVIVSLAAALSLVITASVPPGGWSCRFRFRVSTYLSWLFSYLLSLSLRYVLPYMPRKLRHICTHFRCAFIKDFAVTALTLAYIIATQVGVLNTCDCYTNGGATGLALSQTPAIRRMLLENLNGKYQAIMAVGIIAQLVIFPAIVVVRYWLAVGVFLQRDDGASNDGWLRNLSAVFAGWWTSLSVDFPRWQRNFSTAFARWWRSLPDAFAGDTGARRVLESEVLQLQRV